MNIDPKLYRKVFIHRGYIEPSPNAIWTLSKIQTYNKMSFLKIKDPSKSDKRIAEYIKIKNKIQNDFRSERLGEQSMYEDYGKIFTPITEQQQKSSEEIVSKFAPHQEAIENMPPALPWGQAEPEAVQALPEPPLPINIDQLARKYLVNSYGNELLGLITEVGNFFLVTLRLILKGMI